MSKEKKSVSRNLFDNINIYPKTFEAIEKSYSKEELFNYNIIRIEFTAEYIVSNMKNHLIEDIEKDLDDRNRFRKPEDYYNISDFHFEIFQYREFGTYDVVSDFERPKGNDYVFIYDQELEFQPPEEYISKYYNYHDVLTLIEENIKITISDFSRFDYNFELKFEGENLIFILD
ncbi:hypothetical protein [Flavobacterium caeni]|uniref:Uncharacterized protein n=1 Tax=Flavobacterium caeni TaxID=490189 RepID=A0A1G5KMB0_9FLAO|nr:hypothetical protein [Flavobacterium caeni]SCZ01331.1 hypothetical protein SAMN02927903_03363 [Flavobacterium caeni]